MNKSKFTLKFFKNSIHYRFSKWGVRLLISQTDFFLKICQNFIESFPQSKLSYHCLFTVLKSVQKSLSTPLYAQKLFLHYFDSYLAINPKGIFLWRNQAYFACLSLEQTERMHAYMNLFYHTQEKERENFKQKLIQTDSSSPLIPLLDVIIPSDNLFRSYNVHGYFDVHIKCMEAGLRPWKKIMIPLTENDLMTNPVMLKYWSKYLHVTYDKELISKLNSIREYIEEDLSFSAWIHGKAVYIEHAKSVVQKYWEKENRPPLLSLLPEDQKFGEEKLAELARENQIQLTRETWFVSLHVRDSGYKLGDHRKLDVIDDFRNADIESYVPAIEEIIRRGGIVVRVGDPKMKHLRPIPGLIDYAHSNHRSNLMDVYLFSACKFFIGVSSGPVLNPIIFGVPTLMTNFMPVVGRPHANNCLFLPKLLWLNDEKRYLTFREILSTSIGKIYTTVGYVEKNISIIDNTKEDLMNATIEMLNEIYKNEISHPHHFRDLQDELKKLYERYSGYGDLGFLSYEYLKKCHQLKVI